MLPLSARRTLPVPASVAVPKLTPIDVNELYFRNQAVWRQLGDRGLLSTFYAGVPQVPQFTGLKNVKLEFTGGNRGWLGDSPFVHLDTTRMKKLGWKPQTSIEEGIRRTVRYLKDKPEIFAQRK